MSFYRRLIGVLKSRKSSKSQVPYNGQNDPANANNNHWLIQHTFLVSLVVHYLQDGDVLVGLLTTSKSMRHSLVGYTMKACLSDVQYRNMNVGHRYLPVLFAKLKHIPDMKLTPSNSTAAVSRLCLSHTHSPEWSVNNRENKSLRSLTYLEMGFQFNEPLTADMFPPRLTTLVFGYRFNHPVMPGVFPDSLQHLTLGQSFNQPLYFGSLPDSLTSLELGEHFNHALQIVDDPNVPLDQPGGQHGHLERKILPSQLKILSIGGRAFEKLMPGVLPSTVTTLTIDGLQQMLQSGDVPTSVTHLNLFGYCSKLGVGVLPAGLKRLHTVNLNCMLDQYVLPASLEVLTFGGRYNCYIPRGVLPVHLKQLVFDDFDLPLEPGALPDSLEMLNLGKIFHGKLSPGVLPISLKDLIVHDIGPLGVGSLPPQLTRLVCNNTEIELGSGVLPPSLRHLRLGIDFVRPLDVDMILFGVTELTLISTYERVLRPGVIPQSVTKLHLGVPAFSVGLVTIPTSVTHLVTPVLNAGLIPNCVTHLEFTHTGYSGMTGTSYMNHVSPGVIPNSVTHLRFNSCIQSPLTKGTIPISVTHLVFDTCFEQEIRPSFLPANLQYLELPYRYPHALTLPSSVQMVSFPGWMFVDTQLPRIVNATPRISSHKLEW